MIMTKIMKISGFGKNKMLIIVAKMIIIMIIIIMIIDKY